VTLSSPQRIATTASVSPGSHPGGPCGLLGREPTLGQQEAHRPGYLSPFLTGDLRAATSGDDNKVLWALPAFSADYRAPGGQGLGVDASHIVRAHGPTWRWASDLRWQMFGSAARRCRRRRFGATSTDRPMPDKRPMR
jgi:hypothetical protein